MKHTLNILTALLLTPLAALHAANVACLKLKWSTVGPTA
jgi:hypothetical protein